MTKNIHHERTYDYADGLMRPSDVVELLAISRSTLNKLVRQGEIAPPVVMGPYMVRYRREDVLDFLNGLRPRFVTG